jgi:thiazole synthase
VGSEFPLTPVLNINHPTTVQEALDRVHGASALTGIELIKLEVLDADFKLTRNPLVVDAARQLVDEGFEVWPLITPDPEALDELVGLGCPMVRVMGSPIGARAGIEPGRRDAIETMLERSPVPLMLDGGIGSIGDVERAFEMGFDSVLVNSCLFENDATPAERLTEFRATVDRVRSEVASGTPNGEPGGARSMEPVVERS